MITYTSSDIINRALQLADLENSDFISFSEQIALLNEAYTSLYQKLINKGDNSFVRLIKTSKSTIELPPDFWQLKSVTLDNNGILTQVLRRPANQTINFLSYDLLNNVLQINGNQMGSVIEVEYYPVPPTLTFPNKPRILPDSNILDMHGNYYLTAETDKFVLHDITDSSVNEEITLNPANYPRVHMEDDYITFISNEAMGTGAAAAYFNLNTGDTVVSTDFTKLPAFYRGKTFYYNSGKLYFIDTDTVAFNNVPMVPTGIAILTVCKAIVYSDDLKYYAALTNTGSIVKNGNTISLKKPISKVHSHGGDKIICTTNSDYVATVALDYDGLEETIMDRAIKSVVGIDDNTGYGYLARQLGNKYSIISYFEDTELNFPNNMYFTVLGYLLAIAFKNKQGSDASQLVTLLDAAENTFFDTLTKDDWGTVRITNSY